MIMRELLSVFFSLHISTSIYTGSLCAEIVVIYVVCSLSRHQRQQQWQKDAEEYSTQQQQQHNVGKKLNTAQYLIRSCYRVVTRKCIIVGGASCPPYWLAKTTSRGWNNHSYSLYPLKMDGIDMGVHAGGAGLGEPLFYHIHSMAWHACLACK